MSEHVSPHCSPYADVLSQTGKAGSYFQRVPPEQSELQIILSSIRVIGKNIWISRKAFFRAPTRCPHWPGTSFSTWVEVTSAVMADSWAASLKKCRRGTEPRKNGLPGEVSVCSCAIPFRITSGEISRRSK